MVFFGTGYGQVIAREIASGASLWTATISRDGINGANLVVRSNVLIAPTVFQTVALDAQSGQELWRYEAPKDTVGVSSSLANPGQLVDARIDADNELVYIPAWGASVSAVGGRSGALRWVWQPGVIDGDTASSGVFRSGSMGVRISGDTLFATLWHDTNRAGGTSEAWVVALQRLTGPELWRVKLPFVGSGALIQAAPVLYQNLVIVHTVSGRTFAIDRSSRDIAWAESATGYTISTLAGPEVLGDVVYVDGGDAQIYALRASNGSVVWKGAFGSSTSRDMLLTGRNIIFPTGGELHILDRLSGKQIAVFAQPHTSDPLFASAAQASNGLIYITVAGAAWCFEEP